MEIVGFNNKALLDFGRNNVYQYTKHVHGCHQWVHRQMSIRYVVQAFRLRVRTMAYSTWRS
jgi:hypothetical protein